jgi:hypothetical protein
LLQAIRGGVDGGEAGARGCGLSDERCSTGDEGQESDLYQDDGDEELDEREAGARFLAREMVDSLRSPIEHAGEAISPFSDSVIAVLRMA